MHCAREECSVIAELYIGPTQMANFSPPQKAIPRFKEMLVGRGTEGLTLLQSEVSKKVLSSLEEKFSRHY